MNVVSLTYSDYMYITSDDTHTHIVCTSHNEMNKNKTKNNGIAYLSIFFTAFEISVVSLK